MNEENKQPQQPVEDFADSIDLTRTARQEKLKELRNILHRAADGWFSSNKDVVDAIQTLKEYDELVNDTISKMIKDMYRIVQAVAQTEVSIFSLRTNLKTLILDLNNKKIIDEEELKKLHQEVILPEEIKRIQEVIK